MDPFTILPGQNNADAKGAVTNEPAVVTPPITVPGVDETIAKIKARLEGKQTTPAPTAKPDSAKPGDTPTGDDTDPKTVPPKVLAELGRLQKLVREYEPKTKELDSFKTDAELAREAKKLWASGTHEDKMKAIGMLSGKDPLDEFVNIVKEYYKEEQDKPEGEPTPEIKSLAGKLDEALKKIALLEEGNKSKETQQSKAAADEAQAQANKYTQGFIERNKAKFEICARQENAAEAIDLIQSASMVIIDRDVAAGKLPKDIKEMTPEQAEAVYQEAAAKTEKEFEAIGRRMSKGAQAPSGPDLARFDRFVRKASPPTVKVVTEEQKSTNPDVAFEQLRKRMHERLEAGEFARK
jgi:hypothetical protein